MLRCSLRFSRASKLRNPLTLLFLGLPSMLGVDFSLAESAVLSRLTRPSADGMARDELSFLWDGWFVQSCPGLENCFVVV